MQSSSRTVPVRFRIRRADYRVYVMAQRQLQRLLGSRAPDVTHLIQAQVVGRDAVGLADEYLDRIGWPAAAGRSVSLRVRARTSRGGKQV